MNRSEEESALDSNKPTSSTSQSTAFILSKKFKIIYLPKEQQVHRHFQCKLGVKIILTIKKGGQRVSKWKTLIFLFQKERC